MEMVVLANCLGEIGMPVAAQVLQSGGSAIDALEAGIGPVEADPETPHVGRGGDPNLLGVMEDRRSKLCPRVDWCVAQC